jgi:N-acetylglutamate synthase-like GNAT family acetyltransferase
VISNNNSIMCITIRQAKISDIPAMTSLLEELFSIEADFTVDAQKQQQGLELLVGQPDRAIVLIAEHEDQVIGMLTAQILISTAEGGKSLLLEDMVVTKAYRQQGVGRKILTYMENLAVSSNIMRMQLLADRENHAALGYYTHLGWKETQMVCWRKYPQK